MAEELNCLTSRLTGQSPAWFGQYCPHSPPLTSPPSHHQPPSQSVHRAWPTILDITLCSTFHVYWCRYSTPTTADEPTHKPHYLVFIAGHHHISYDLSLGILSSELHQSGKAHQSMHCESRSWRGETLWGKLPPENQPHQCHHESAGGHTQRPTNRSFGPASLRAIYRRQHIWTQ